MFPQSISSPPYFQIPSLPTSSYSSFPSSSVRPITILCLLVSASSNIVPPFVAPRPLTTFYSSDFFSLPTVFLGSLLPRVTWMLPTFVSLNIRIASEWVNPATDRPFTENISSPGKQFLMRMSVGGKYGQQNPLTDGQTLNDPSFETESIPHPI